LAKNSIWILYLIECHRGTGTAYYTGITTDIERRYQEHCTGIGARFTRANRPVRILATREYPDRSLASRAEAEVKKLPRHKKRLYFKHE
jgi:putative endonuclease